MAARQIKSFAALSNTAKVLLGVLIVALTSSIYYLGMHMELTEKIDGEQQKRVRLEGEVREAQSRQQEYLRLRKELAWREERDRRNLRILPEHAEIPGFLADLNRLAELSGLRMKLVQPRPEEMQEFFVRLPVSLALSGRYHQLAKFFYNVSTLDRAINMEDISLKDPERKGEEVTLSVTVLATTFRRLSESEKPSPSDAKKKG
ncbi:MAG: type 4a pilus biogenesis protein PilO [Proteobacteria bacterium]|nr:type 4a pilus biogenesis protein PilO [Pseudomonadota bacterium]